MEETVKLSFSHPLFSCFITLYTLILIYFPYDSLQLLLSPVLLISGALILSLLRLGSTRESITRPGKIHEKTESLNLEKKAEESRDSETKLDSMMGDFVEWNLRAPLEVIHEAYEDDDGEEEEKDPTRFREIERFPSLSVCYPESDSGSDSDSSSDFNFPEIGNNWISPEKMVRFRWEEEEEEDEDGIGGEGLIEIKLDECNRKIIRSKWDQTEFDFHSEEDGLIEIDIFP